MGLLQTCHRLLKTIGKEDNFVLEIINGNPWFQAIIREQEEWSVEAPLS